MSRLAGYWDMTETLTGRAQQEERDHGGHAPEGCRFFLAPEAFVLSLGPCEEVSSSLCHINHHAVLSHHRPIVRELSNYR